MTGGVSVVLRYHPGRALRGTLHDSWYMPDRVRWTFVRLWAPVPLKMFIFILRMIALRAKLLIANRYSKCSQLLLLYIIILTIYARVPRVS